MAVEEYWLGKGLDLDGIWADFDAGGGYITKVGGSRLHLLRLTFSGHPTHLPLFDHEVIYKTVKGTFHDVKVECFTPVAYDAASPIFLQRVARGSGIFEFLAEVNPLITWVVALGGAAVVYRKMLAADLEFDERKLTFLHNNFPGASNADEMAFMKAWTTFGHRRVMQRLIGQGLRRVEVSKFPLAVDPTKKLPEMVDMSNVVTLDDAQEDA